jgi:hypothetical protein
MGFAAALLAGVLAYALWSASAPEEGGPDGARLRASRTLDLETGEEGGAKPDLLWVREAHDRPYLVASPGALVAGAQGARWQDLTPAKLAALNYSGDRYPAWGPDAPVRAGAVFGVRTVEGNLAKVRVARIRANGTLQLEWVVYEPGRAPAATAEAAPAAPPQAEAKPDPQLLPLPEAKAKAQPIKPPPPGPALAWLGLRDKVLAAYREHRHADAYEACGKAVAAAEPAGGAHHALALVTCGGLLELHRRHPEQVEDWLKQAKALTAKLDQDAIVAALGPREALLRQRALRMLGVFYRDRDRTGEAAENFALAVDTVRALPPPETAEHRLAVRADLYDLGVALARLGYRGTARRALGEAREYYLKTEPEHPALRAIDAQLKRLDEKK